MSLLEGNLLLTFNMNSGKVSIKFLPLSFEANAIY